MKVVIVDESMWGSTAAVARAIAEGIGPDSQVLTTDEAIGAAVAGADLLVAGAPVMAFGLPSDSVRAGLARDPGKAPTLPDLSRPSMRSWLDSLPEGRGRSAAFETRIRWSPGGSTGAISKGLERAGYAPFAKPQKFIVTGTYGPLAEGEIERARRWGVELAVALRASVAGAAVG